MRALLRKETLEILRWLPLALLLTCSATWVSLNGNWLSDISPLITATMFCGSLVSLGIALLQSIPDERNGARAYLLHRGVSAAQVFWAKTCVGFGFVFVTVGLPLALTALWLSVRGVLNGPGRPIQVLPPAVIALTALLFHPTVLLIIFRPARWLGSRVVPILIPIAALMLCDSTVDGIVTLGQLGSMVTMSLLLLAIMLAAARRAYVDLARQPAASSPAHRSLAVSMVVFAGMMLLVAGLGIFIFGVDQLFRPSVAAPSYHYVLANKSDGQFWLVKARHIWNKDKKVYDMEYLNGGPLVSDAMPDISGPVPSNFQKENGVSLPLWESSSYYSNPDIAYDAFRGIDDQRWINLMDRRGYLLSYERFPLSGNRLALVISREGIRDPQGDWGRPFDGLFEVDLWNMNLNLVADHHGIYQVLESSRELQPLIERPMDFAKLSFSYETDEPLRIFIRSGSQLSIYQLMDTSGIVRSGNTNKVKVNGALSVQLIDQLELPQIVAQLPAWNVVYRSSDDWAVHGYGGVRALSGSIARRAPGSSEVTSFAVTTPPETYLLSMRDVQLASLFSTPVPSLLEPLFRYLTQGRQQLKSLAEVSGVPARWLPWVIAMFLCQGAIAAALAWYAARRRGLSQRATWLWSGVSMVFGWAGPLAVLACYPRIVCEPCTHCQKPRRVDRVVCEHCQANWERPQREGIEIIEHEFDRLVQVGAASE